MGMELTAPPCAHSRVGGSSDTTPPCVCDRVLVQAGGPAHFDEYNNLALVLCGRKRFFIAPYAAMAWKDGEQNGEHNERRDSDEMCTHCFPELTHSHLFGSGCMQTSALVMYCF